MIDLIYCAGANPRLTQIAHEAGYLLGIRSDRQSYGFPISFVDIEYREPDFERHLAVVKRHQPKYATVPDLSETEISEEDITRAVKQAKRLSEFCEVVLVVPKLSGQIALLPEEIAIGYSVPTSYGGARSIALWEMSDRSVHILGGNPHEQMKAYRYLEAQGKVMSADGNMAQKIAIRFAKYWEKGRWMKHPDKGKGRKDLYMECWQMSCMNIQQSWKAVSDADAEG